MIRFLIALLFLLLPFNAFATSCDDEDEPSNNLAFEWDCKEKDWGETITKWPSACNGKCTDDVIECPIFDKLDLASFTKDNAFAGIERWTYKAKDKKGNTTAVCKRGTPTVNEMYYIIREGKFTPEESIYTVGTAYCKTRNISEVGDTLTQIGTLGIADQDTRRDGYCTLGSGALTGYTEGAEITFDVSDIVGTESSKGSKNLGAKSICLVRYKKGDTFRHTESTAKYEGAVNKVCGYIVSLLHGGNCDTSAAFHSWDASLIGCVIEPPPPGPDVFNSVIPTGLSPRVDYSICLDDQGTGPLGCDKDSGTNLVARGSTFDRPVITLTAHEVGRMDLKYSFTGDSDGNASQCGQFQSDLFASDSYCAHVPRNKPNKVCACKKRDDGLTKDIFGHTDYCGENNYIGCTDRPTLEHSNLKLVAEFSPYEDEYRGRSYPAVKPAFVRTNNAGQILYVDEQGDRACLNVADSTYYKCNGDNLTPSNQRSQGELSYVERLKLPLASDKPIREYHIQFDNEDYSCKDDDNTSVKLDEDGEFYKMENGKITTIPANGKPNCTGFRTPANYDCEDNDDSIFINDQGNFYKIHSSNDIYIKNSNSYIKVEFNSAVINDLSGTYIEFDATDKIYIKDGSQYHKKDNYAKKIYIKDGANDNKFYKTDNKTLFNELPINGKPKCSKFPGPNYYSCEDSSTPPHNVRISSDTGLFHKVFNDETHATIQAVGKVTCSFPMLQSSYIEGKQRVYGVDFSAAIAQSEGLSVKFGRYTSSRDRVAFNQVCTPLQMTTICDVQGTTNFYPDGDRSTKFCYLPSLAGCERYGATEHDLQAASLYCPGTYTGPIDPQTPSNICLIPSTSWYFQTKEDYINTIAISGDLAKYSVDCNRKISIDTMCAPIEMGCRRVDIPTEASGLAKWPDMQKGQSIDGECDESLGYTKYVKPSPFTPHFTKTKAEICDNKDDPMVTCDDFYQSYLDEGTALRAQFAIEEQTAYNNYEKFNWGGFLGPFYSKYKLHSNGNIIIYVSTKIPNKTCNAGGTATIINHCVRQ